MILSICSCDKSMILGGKGSESTEWGSVMHYSMGIEIKFGYSFYW